MRLIDSGPSVVAVVVCQQYTVRWKLGFVQRRLSVDESVSGTVMWVVWVNLYNCPVRILHREGALLKPMNSDSPVWYFKIY